MNTNPRSYCCMYASKEQLSKQCTKQEYQDYLKEQIKKREELIRNDKSKSKSLRKNMSKEINT
jgi:hypothetical protein